MITQNYLCISPAYGRDFLSAKAVIEHFNSGADFKMESLGQGGTYCSKSDFEKGVMVTIRYNKLRKVTVTKVE